jgi:magnesium transporter
MELIEEYAVHELVAEDLLWLHVQDKVDIYDDHLSLVIHFPKYNSKSQRYLLNEVTVTIGKNWIITTSRFETNTLITLKDKLVQESQEYESDEKYKITPYYILYEIIDMMYNKTSRILSNSATEVFKLEEWLLSHKLNKQVLADLMIKKRNISFLHYNYRTHEELIEETMKWLPKLYTEDLEVYFDDLLYRHQKIMLNIAILQENVDSITDTYNWLMTVNTNNTLLWLTIFSGIMLPLTLIVWLFGMNVPMEFVNHPLAFRYILAAMIAIVIAAIVRVRHKEIS